MFEWLHHKFQSVVDRHGLWLNLCLLLLLSYSVLTWVLTSSWWQESYRTPATSGLRFKAKLNGFDFRPAVRPDKMGELRLIGTLVSEGSAPTAIVEYRGARMILRPGQRLQGGMEVVSIESGLLTMKADTTFHTLALPVPVNQSGQTGQPGRKAEVGVQIDLDRRGAIESFPSLLWTPVPMGGAFIAMRLRPSAPARIAETFGLRTGDLVESVNGLPVTGDDVREKLLDRIRNDEKIVIVVRREGRALRLRYSLYD